MEVKIGGERLGSGNKMKAHFNNYERSTHDIGYLWRSTMSAGTLVPFMSEVALPGDTFDINLGCSVLTHPTIGPLFGTYKVQLDVFGVPVRLYHSALHSNMLDIGMKMSTIKLPSVRIKGRNKPTEKDDLDNYQINSSSIFKYLGISGLGYREVSFNENSRLFNAIPWLAYWDIYKNYYANKQEEIGAVIHHSAVPDDPAIDQVLTMNTNPDNVEIPTTTTFTGTPVSPSFNLDSMLKVICTNGGTYYNIPNFMINYEKDNVQKSVQLQSLFRNFWHDTFNDILYFQDLNDPSELNNSLIYGVYFNTSIPVYDGSPQIHIFDLDDIDKMRTKILQSSPTVPFVIDDSIGLEPYVNALEQGVNGSGTKDYSCTFNQEGLALKTYQSDLFNNWLSSEWIDGVDGISAITAVSTAGNNFTIDELNMSKKIYDMLNRIALSGGTYDDWLDAVYTHERNRGQENPAYLGGLIKELTFQEVISNAAAETGEGKQPLGTLAGRGVMTNKHKGGHIIAKFDEPSYLIGIISITPRVDYSQGNKWDVNLKTMDDFHKPALDEIGFQDLITDQMAYWDTGLNMETPVFKSAGKQPAWINYMTNVNQVRGNFAVKDQQMFMVLNRRYEPQKMPLNQFDIKDLTTYIDPSKFNHIFADTRIDAQNFWAQISLDITARRKMSAKIIPNL